MKDPTRLSQLEPGACWHHDDALVYRPPSDSLWQQCKDMTHMWLIHIYNNILFLIYINDKYM